MNPNGNYPAQPNPYGQYGAPTPRPFNPQYSQPGFQPQPMMQPQPAFQPQPMYQQPMYAPQPAQGSYAPNPAFGQAIGGLLGLRGPRVNQNLSNNYRTMNWNGYNPQVYNISPQFIEMYAAGIFAYFDKDGSGTLEMNEIPQMLNHLFAYLKVPPPTLYDALFLMYTFDADKNGKMDLGEFKTMLYYLGGQRQ